MDESDEVTAWHEAGHAAMAILQGGFIERVTIEPANDDGPSRYGDTVTRWSGLNASELAIAEIYVSLAGPIAEMLYTGERRPFDNVPEWAADWQRAVAHAVAGTSSLAASERLMQESAGAIFELFERESHWAAIGAIADNLLAFETIEHEQVAEAVEFWNS